MVCREGLLIYEFLLPFFVEWQRISVFDPYDFYDPSAEGGQTIREIHDIRQLFSINKAAFIAFQQF